jgi:hypothetical protein
VGYFNTESVARLNEWRIGEDIEGNRCCLIPASASRDWGKPPVEIRRQQYAITIPELQIYQSIQFMRYDTCSLIGGLWGFIHIKYFHIYGTVLIGKAESRIPEYTMSEMCMPEDHDINFYFPTLNNQIISPTYACTWCNWKVRTIFLARVPHTKTRKIFISTWVLKHFICEL